jgi:DNA-binding NtrC family response regulator
MGDFPIPSLVRHIFRHRTQKSVRFWLKSSHDPLIIKVPDTLKECGEGDVAGTVIAIRIIVRSYEIMSTSDASLVLVVSNGKDIQGLTAALDGSGFRVEAAGSKSEAAALFRDHRHDLVLLDLGDAAEGLEVLDRLHKMEPVLPIIVMAERSQTKEVARAIEKGAFDWISKPVDSQKLINLVSSLIARKGMLVKPVSLDGGLREEPNFRKIVGSSQKIGDVFESIDIVKNSDVPVVIQGETGTGKELVAMAIHYRGPRRKQPFFPVNCAAIPETLLESELFGHERGSFTGAVERRKGKFELANGGTLFLDEIAEMPPSTQVKILRVIEDHTFRRVGGSELIHVDVRIISASNKDLTKEVAANRFREDLYYRLSVFPIHLPPLRERRNDIQELAYYFLQRSSGETGKPDVRISEAALEAMRLHPWPGNVRELQNTIKRAALLATDGLIEPSHLGLRDGETDSIGGDGVGTDIEQLLGSLKRGEVVPLDQIEEIFIRQALHITDGNITEAANRLGISRSTIYRKLQEYGLDKG